MVKYIVGKTLFVHDLLWNNMFLSQESGWLGFHLLYSTIISLDNYITKYTCCIPKEDFAGLLQFSRYINLLLLSIFYQLAS